MIHRRPDYTISCSISYRARPSMIRGDPGAGRDGPPSGSGPRRVPAGVRRTGGTIWEVWGPPVRPLAWPSKNIFILKKPTTYYTSLRSRNTFWKLHIIFRHWDLARICIGKHNKLHLQKTCQITENLSNFTENTFFSPVLIRIKQRVVKSLLFEVSGKTNE